MSVHLSPELRDLFDETVEEVLRELPRAARDLLERVPLLVEDRPNAVHSEALGVDDALLGLYTGVPLTERSVENAGEPAEACDSKRLHAASNCAAGFSRRVSSSGNDCVSSPPPRSSPGETYISCRGPDGCRP